MKQFLAYTITLLCFFAIACNNQESPKDKVVPVPDDEITATDIFIYEHVDASVPPQYHRSYSIKVTPTIVNLTVTDYSNTLLSDSATLTPAAYSNFVKEIAGLNITNKEENDSQGCTGGKTDKLDLYSGNPLAVKGSVYHCGGEDYGNLRGDINAAVGLFKKMVPDVEKKVDATRN